MLYSLFFGMECFAWTSTGGYRRDIWNTLEKIYVCIYSFVFVLLSFCSHEY